MWCDIGGNDSKCIQHSWPVVNPRVFLIMNRNLIHFGGLCCWSCWCYWSIIILINGNKVNATNSPFEPAAAICSGAAPAIGDGSDTGGLLVFAVAAQVPYGCGLLDEQRQ
jgi:hypothetical protein